MEPYSELGVSPGASAPEIKAAYRKLVFEYHPDRHASSSATEQQAAAARFRAITEAYDCLTNGRAQSAIGASGSSSYSSYSRRPYNYHNVNTDWSESHYTHGSSGYTSRLSRWELYQRLMKQSFRDFSRTIHVGLAVLLVGGGLLFEYSYSAVWNARNKGKSFEDLQAIVKAQQQQQNSRSRPNAASTSSSRNNAGIKANNSQTEHLWHVRSCWLDGMRGRLLPPEDRGDGSAGPQMPGTAASASTR